MLIHIQTKHEEKRKKVEDRRKGEDAGFVFPYTLVTRKERQVKAVKKETLTAFPSSWLVADKCNFSTGKGRY